MFGKKNEDKLVKAETQLSDLEAADARQGGSRDSTENPTAEKRKSRTARTPRGPMDSRRKLSILTGACVAVTIGAVGFSAIQYSQASEMTARLEGSTAKVLVATEDLPAGTTLTAENTELALVPSRYIPTNAAESEDDAVGLTTLTAVTAGLPIDLSSLSGSETPAGLPVAIRDGYVAKMVSLDTASGLSPLLAPGDYVTVSGYDEETGEVITHTGVRVLAVDGSLSGAAGTEYSTVTLELHQEQADSLLGLVVSLTAEPASAHVDDEETAAGKATEDGVNTLEEAGVDKNA